MSSAEMVGDFVAQRSLAVVGASRNPKKFGALVLKNLREKGYDVVAVNPNAGD